MHKNCTRMAWWPGIHGVMVLTDAQLGHQTKRNGTEQDNQKPNGAKNKGMAQKSSKESNPPKNDNLTSHANLSKSKLTRYIYCCIRLHGCTAGSSISRKVISVSFSGGESREACFTPLLLRAALCQSWEARLALPSKTRQHLVWVREAHFLVRLQGRLPLHIVLQRLTGDLVVESSLRECREQVTMLHGHLP